MSGLLALLDDVAALAKVAAATVDDASAQAMKVGSKTAGIVIDDAAVTPRYVTGLGARRELPVIWKITKGSLFNKLVILLPVALLLSEFLPQAITPLLMFGGLFLCFEGYEKVHEMLAPHDEPDATEAAAARVLDAKALEAERVSGAVRTDFILSAEIMAVSLAAITSPDLFTRGLVLALVAVLITVFVYGAVALIVKADDFGVYLARRGGPVSAPFGRLLANGMPTFLKGLSFVGMIAMLWVGGGILVHGLAEFGFNGLEHGLENVAATVGSFVPVAEGFVEWIVHAAGSALLGLIAGAIVALALMPFTRTREGAH